MICINCGADDEGKLCSNCGQPLQVKRITIREQWHDFVDKEYGLDGQFFQTVKELTIKPGYVAREFLRGNRVRYFGPIGYYFFMITLFLLVLSMIGMNFTDYMKAMQEQMPMQDQSNSEFGNNTRNWVSDNMKLVAFIIPPFMAFAAQRVFFRKQGLNFLEHSVPVFYLLGHWYWFSTIEAVVFHYFGYSIGSGAQLIIVSLYLGFGYVTFIPTQPKWKTFLKGMGVYWTGYTLMFIVAMIVGIAIVFIMLSIDPNSLDAIRPSKNPTSFIH
jgi:hypothetical protein